MKKNIISMMLLGVTCILFPRCSEDFISTSPYASNTDVVYFKTSVQLEEALMYAYKTINLSSK